MDLELTTEQKLLKDSVRDFAEKEIGPVIEELDRKEIFSADLTHKMGELGLWHHHLPGLRGHGYGLSLLYYRC